MTHARTSPPGRSPVESAGAVEGARVRRRKRAAQPSGKEAGGGGAKRLGSARHLPIGRSGSEAILTGPPLPSVVSDPGV